MSQNATNVVAAVMARWRERLDEPARRRQALAGDFLQFHYDVGRLALELVEQEASGGAQSVRAKRVLSDVMAPRVHMHPENLQACMQFARQTRPEELEDLKAREVPWFVVRATLSVRDAVRRDGFRRDYVAGKFEGKGDLAAAVAEDNATGKLKGVKKKARRDSPRYKSGAATALSTIKSTRTALHALSSKIAPSFVSSVREVAKHRASMNPATIGEIDRQLGVFGRAFHSLDCMVRQMKEATASALAEGGATPSARSASTVGHSGLNTSASPTGLPSERGEA